MKKLIPVTALLALAGLMPGCSEVYPPIWSGTAYGCSEDINEAVYAKLQAAARGSGFSLEELGDYRSGSGEIELQTFWVLEAGSTADPDRSKLPVADAVRRQAYLDARVIDATWVDDKRLESLVAAWTKVISEAKANCNVVIRDSASWARGDSDVLPTTPGTEEARPRAD